MTDKMTANQALGFLCSAIRCGAGFHESCEEAASIIRQALTAPRVPDELRSVVADIRAHCNPPNPETCDDVTPNYALSWADRIEALLTTAPAPADAFDDSYSVIGDGVAVMKPEAGRRILDAMKEAHSTADQKPADNATDKRFDYSVLADAVRRRNNNPTAVEEAKKRLADYDREFASAAKRAAPKAELAMLRERVKVLEAAYSELLYQVHEKIPGQSRHETALARLLSWNAQSNEPECNEAARLRGGSDE
jgi:hypothetical protein